ncbi:MAG: DUF4381 domain-containing protein [Xanthomonadales bacterium]|nr:DUF4381 domain-containing protein [Xanthomonadales bacterium]
MNDTGSLQNLNDIVLPGAVPWWPAAPGWYVLAAVLAIALTILATRWWNTRSRNRYRRQALAELAVIRRSKTGDAVQRLPTLVKRAALAAWPRERVASLSGAGWHRFLDESAGGEHFGAGAGVTLDWLAYRTNTAGQPSREDLDQVLDATEFWLKNHVGQQEGV